MNPPEHFEIENDCAFFRPVGEMSLQVAVELVTNAVTFARQQGIPKLLVNATGVTGFPPPTLAERYFLAREWAAAAKSSVQVAIVVRPELIDPDKFGVMVARNAGLNGDVFPAEAEALAWLLGQATN